MTDPINGQEIVCKLVVKAYRDGRVTVQGPDDTLTAATLLNQAMLAGLQREGQRRVENKSPIVQVKSIVPVGVKHG